jgi:RimJ/RimL family protein N-acetyltransferase
MTESLSLVLDHVFTSLPHEVDAVTASIFPDNVASEKLLKKLWFLYDHSLDNGMQVGLLGCFEAESSLTGRWRSNRFIGWGRIVGSNEKQGRMGRAKKL